MRSLGGLETTPQLAPGEHRTVGGSNRTPRHASPRGMGLTWLTTGPARVGGDGSTLWVFWNKSALGADLRVFESVGCRALGCVVPRGPQKHPSAAPWGASYRRGVTKDTRPHLRKGLRLDLADDGTRSRGRGGSTLWVFWNKSALRADLRVFQSIGCRALGCGVPRGPQTHPSAAPWGAWYRRGSQRTLGHTSARDIGLTWWTTGPAGVGGAARRYGFFGTSPHFVRTSESFKT